MVLPVSSSDFMSLRIQAQPPVPCSEHLLATMPALIGAPSSSWITPHFLLERCDGGLFPGETVLPRR